MRNSLTEAQRSLDAARNMRICTVQVNTYVLGNKKHTIQGALRIGRNKPSRAASAKSRVLLCPD